MRRHTMPLSCLLVVAALATGCATAPTSAPAATSVAATDCRQLAAEIARTEEARRAALEKEQGAWKAVIPFAVAARYASGKSDGENAEQRLAALNAEFSRQGCHRHGN